MIVLDTSSLPAAERADAFENVMLDVSVPQEIIHEAPREEVQARVDVWELGHCQMFTVHGSGFALRRTRRHLRMDGPPVIALGLQEEGSARFEQRARQQALDAHDLMLNDLETAYDFGWSGSGRSICLQATHDRLALPPETLHRAAERLPGSPLYGLLRHHILALTAQGLDPGTAFEDDPGAPAVGAASIDLLRALVVSAAGHGERLREVRHDTMASRVLAYVRMHVREPDLTPERVARVHNVSVRALYKLFEQQGLSLEQYVIELRLEGARAELGTHPTRPVAPVARAWGFSHPSHFSRRFRAAYGVTPSQYARSCLLSEGR